MKTLIAQCVLVLGLLVSVVGYAADLDLDTAKSGGLVGEATTGLLAPVNPDNVSAAVEALIKDVNKQRMQRYAGIAKKNNIKVSDVAARAYAKAVERTEAGNYYQKPDGQWTKK